MTLPFPLHTARLTIRPFTLDDLEAAHALFNETSMWQMSLELRRDWLEWTVRNYVALARLWQPPYGDYAVTLKEGGELIGSVGIAPAVVPWGVFEAPPHTFVSPEFGLFWATAKAHQRRGIAVEAAQAVTDYLFGQMRVTRVVATTERDNLASQAVMHKLSMDVKTNPGSEPPWFEVVGVLENPAKP